MIFFLLSRLRSTNNHGPKTSGAVTNKTPHFLRCVVRKLHALLSFLESNARSESIPIAYPWYAVLTYWQPMGFQNWNRYVWMTANATAIPDTSFQTAHRTPLTGYRVYTLHCISHSDFHSEVQLSSWLTPACFVASFEDLKGKGI